MTTCRFVIVDGYNTSDEAKAFCRNLGGILANIENNTENTQAKDVGYRLGFSVWIGATDQGSEATWRRAESGRVCHIKCQSSRAGHTNWQCGLPEDRYFV